MCHVRDATPFVAGQKPDGMTIFVQQFGAREKAKNDLSTLRLIQAVKIGGIQLNFSVANRQPVPRNKLIRPL